MFTTKRRINFYDCDPAGILFYGRIYDICHSTYEEMIQSFNLTLNYWNNDDFVVPIIHSEAKYYKPVKIGETITIEIKTSQLRNSSFELEYITKNETGEKCHVVKTVHVVIDKKSWKKIDMPEEVKAGLSKHLI